MTQQPRTPTQITDPTGQVVAANVRRIRDEVRGWSTYELSRKLKLAHRPIAPSALAKLERGERRVDVGDLMALAYVLQVNPNALLLPPEAAGEVELTAAGAYPASDVWDWAEGERPLDLPEGDDGTAHNLFQTDARPAGRRKFVTGPAAAKTTTEGRTRIDAFREAFQHEHGRQPTQDEVVNWMFGAQSDGSSDG
ncbi:helix-turn-helix domain-containing protein [Streptomyces sp. NPDC058320]|uniref:helix-turn-helix domain-containing protein n=1 Tax=unclassified Streptomyces TaxID=2593676 RepID=UPI003638738B